MTKASSCLPPALPAAISFRPRRWDTCFRARLFVHLVTDSRAERYAGTFPAEAIHTVASATIGSKNPIAVAKALLSLWKELSPGEATGADAQAQGRHRLRRISDRSAASGRSRPRRADARA